MTPVSPTLSDADREELIELLENSRQELEQLAALSTGESWVRRPGEDRWSVGEVVEHLVLSEEAIFGMAVAALETEADAGWESIAAVPTVGIVAQLTDRSQKFQAPEALSPTGEMGRAEALERFAGLRAKTLDFARTTTAPLKQHTAAGPAGKMNAHQWLTLVGAHNLRHNLQIIEAQADLAEPMEKMEKMEEMEATGTDG